MRYLITALLIAFLFCPAATGTALAQSDSPAPYIEPGYRIINSISNDSHGLSYVYDGTERVGTYCLYVVECDTFAYTPAEPPSGHANPYTPEDFIADDYDIELFADGSARITDPAQSNLLVTFICMAWEPCDHPNIWPDTPRRYLPIAFNP